MVFLKANYPQQSLTSLLPHLPILLPEDNPFQYSQPFFVSLLVKIVLFLLFLFFFYSHSNVFTEFKIQKKKRIKTMKNVLLTLVPSLPNSHSEDRNITSLSYILPGISVHIHILLFIDQFRYYQSQQMRIQLSLLYSIFSFSFPAT